MVTKHRLEAFTDGVIAIIITIIVLSVPVPKHINSSEILEFIGSISIYFLSFIVVAAFWNQHHRAFHYIEKTDAKITAINMLFLFFLSLSPLFTKWVIENPGSLIPVIAYDIDYLLVSLLYALMFRLIVQQSNHNEIKQLSEQFRTKQNTKPQSSWIPFIILLVVMFVVIITSLYFPKVATVFLFGIPIVSSVLNLFVIDKKKEKRFVSKD
jgi:uncharacterized membrane protein